MTEPMFLAVLSGPQIGQSVSLAGDESRHATQVRRIRVGEVVLISDGAGTAVRGPVTISDKTGLTINVAEVLREPSRPLRYVAVLALAKGDRAELAVETMTELGVDEVIPWPSERSVVRWAPDRVERGLTRWRATAREAAKQSRRFRVPTVTPPVTTAELVQRIEQTQLTLVLHEGAEQLLALLPVPTSGEVMFIIGPEGGLTNDEVAEFVAAGAKSVLISDAVLRTSSAGVVALAQLQALAARG